MKAWQLYLAIGVGLTFGTVLAVALKRWRSSWVPAVVFVVCFALYYVAELAARALGAS